MTETTENKEQTQEAAVPTKTKRLMEGLAKATSNLPTNLKVTRFDITLPLAPTPFSRGDKKSYKVNYLGLPKVTKDNLVETFQFVGEEKMCQMLNLELGKYCQTATEDAVLEEYDEETGNIKFFPEFQAQKCIEGIEKFSARGETIKDLNEIQADMASQLADLMKEHDFAKITSTPELMGKFQELLTEQSRVVGALQKKKRA